MSENLLNILLGIEIEAQDVNNLESFKNDLQTMADNVEKINKLHIETQSEKSIKSENLDIFKTDIVGEIVSARDEIMRKIDNITFLFRTSQSTADSESKKLMVLSDIATNPKGYYMKDVQEGMQSYGTFSKSTIENWGKKYGFDPSSPKAFNDFIENALKNYATEAMKTGPSDRNKAYNALMEFRQKPTANLLRTIIRGMDNEHGELLKSFGLEGTSDLLKSGNEFISFNEPMRGWSVQRSPNLFSDIMKGGSLESYDLKGIIDITNAEQSALSRIKNLKEVEDVLGDERMEKLRSGQYIVPNLSYTKNFADILKSEIYPSQMNEEARGLLGLKTPDIMASFEGETSEKYKKMSENQISNDLERFGLPESESRDYLAKMIKNMVENPQGDISKYGFVQIAEAKMKGDVHSTRDMLGEFGSTYNPAGITLNEQGVHDPSKGMYRFNPRTEQQMYNNDEVMKILQEALNEIQKVNSEKGLSQAMNDSLQRLQQIEDDVKQLLKRNIYE